MSSPGKAMIPTRGSAMLSNDINGKIVGGIENRTEQALHGGDYKAREKTLVAPVIDWA